MKNKTKTKKIGGTDLSAQHFLFTDSQPLSKFWLLPICDPTSRTKTIVLIQRNLDHWDSIKRHIPIDQQQNVRAQLEGAAMAYGIPIPEVALSADEVRMLAERCIERMLESVEIDRFYDFSMDALM